MAQKLSTLANEIWPLLLPRIQKMVADAGAGGGGAAQLAAHDLSGSLHKGTLADAQFPQGLLRNGSRSLAGNLSVDAGVTIDGVDLDAHAANPDAHHARAHVLATAAGLGADHSMSGAAAGQTLRANSATNAMWAYLSHTDLTGVTADQHHAKQHDIVDAANHTVSGAAWNVVGATALNTLGLMLARSDATATPKETLLKSDASGYLNLVRLIASDRLRASLVDTPTGQHLTVQPDADLLLDPVSKLVKAQTDVALQASNYASQVTGWRITHNGQADFRYMFVDEMHAKSFIADLEQALAGGQIISKSVAMLASTFTAPGAAAGSITFRAKATAQTNTTTLTCNKPTGTVQNDVMIAHVIHWNSLTVTTPPSGWTLLTTQTGGSYSNLKVYYRVAGASEGASYTWTFSGTDDVLVEIQSWTNVDTSNPIDVYGGAGSSSNGTNVVAPSISPTVGNTRLLFLAAFNDSNNTSANATPPSGYTEQTDQLGSQYSWLYSANKAQAATGATGTATAVMGANHQWVVVHLALRPASVTTAVLTVRDLPSAPGMAVFQAGDIVRLRQFSRSAGSLSIADCWGAVTGYTDNGDKTQTWTFTRSSSPNAGSMTAGTTVQPDAIVLDYGVDGNGFAETNAIDGAYGVNSPYTQTVRWTGHPATGQAVRTRLGQLRGIFGQDEFGLFAGTGTANTDRYVRISDYAAGNGINNLPFSLRNAGTEVVRLGGWNDVWVGPSSADKRLAWDGTTLTVKGSIVVQSGSSGIGAFTDAGALATVSNLDGVPDGSTYKRTTANEKTGAGRAYSGLDSTGALVTKVVPGSNVGAPAGTGLYLGADYLGYYDSAGAAGKKWTVFIDNTGKFGLGGTSGARLSWDGTDLFGTDGTTVQWYARATDGRLYAGGGNVVLDAAGLSLFRQATTTPAIKWRVGATSYGGVSYYTSGDGYETVRFMVSADPSRILLATYNPGDANNPPASITIQQNAYTPLVAIKGATTVTGTLAVSGALTAASLNGYPLSASGDRWGVIPYVDGAAFMDVGAYIDFHAADGDAAGVRQLRLDGGMTYTAGLGITNAYGYVAVGPNNSSYCHFQTDRTAYYFDHPLVITNGLSSYNADLTLSRNGTNRLIGYSWGTYVTAHLTMEDVLGIVNVQSSKPAAPSSGCKIYLRDQGGGDGVQLYMQRTNGAETKLS